MKKNTFSPILNTVIIVLGIQYILLGSIILLSSRLEIKIEPFGSIVFREK